jgi:hypothetical protein
MDPSPDLLRLTGRKTIGLQITTLHKYLVQLTRKAVQYSFIIRTTPLDGDKQPDTLTL